MKNRKKVQIRVEKVHSNIRNKHSRVKTLHNVHLHAKAKNQRNTKENSNIVNQGLFPNFKIKTKHAKRLILGCYIKIHTDNMNFNILCRNSMFLKGKFHTDNNLIN